MHKYHNYMIYQSSIIGIYMLLTTSVLLIQKLEFVSLQKVCLRPWNYNCHLSTWHKLKWLTKLVLSCKLLVMFTMFIIIPFIHITMIDTLKNIFNLNPLKYTRMSTKYALHHNIKLLNIRRKFSSQIYL